MFDLFRQLDRDRSGSIAIAAAASITILALGVGAVTEYGRALGLRTSLSGALDGATLAAASRLSTESLSDQAVDDLVRTQLTANLALNESVEIKSLTVQIDEDAGLLRASVTSDMPLFFGGVLGMDSIEVAATSAATYGSRTIEMALVLDVTGSMEGQKLTDLKTAATDLVTQLLPADGSMDHKVRISVVPFAQAVNVGAFAPQVKQNTGGYWAYSKKKGSYWVAYENSCATERNSDSFMDDSPLGNPLRGDASACPTSTVLPLTNSRSAVLDRINGFVASGGTAGHLGIAFGWYTLSPLWGDIWPSSSLPVAYGDHTTLKFLVFMTDGDFNTWYTNGNGDSTAQAEAFCTNAKASGITLFTVGFQTSTAATDMMRRCASSATNFFATSTGGDLVSAFRTIARTVQTIYLAS